MAGNLTVKLKLEANEKAATAALKSAQRETKQLSKDAKSASVQATVMGKSYQQSANNSTAALVKMQQGLKGVLMSTLALVAGGGALALGGNIIEQADAYKNLSSRIRLVTESEEQLAAVRQQLIDQAQENRVAISAVTQLYAGVTPVLKELGKSQEDILSITDSVSKSLIIGGATAGQSSAAILQLTQAMASGVLRGDEFNSLMENAPALMRSFADSMGLPVGSLRKLAEEGKLTSDILANSLISQNDAIKESFGDVDVTVSTAMVNVKNSLLVYIGEADEALGFTKALSAGLVALANDLSIGATAAAALGTVGIAHIAAASARSEKGMIRRARLRKAETAQAVESAAIESAALQKIQVEDARLVRTSLAKAKAKKAAMAVTLAASQAEVKASAITVHTAKSEGYSATTVAQATNVHTAALGRLQVAQRASIAATRSVVSARKAEAVATATTASITTAAMAKTTVSTRVLSASQAVATTSTKAMSAALMLVGGPVGAAVLAALGIYTYSQELIDLISHSDDAEKAEDSHKVAMGEARDMAYEYAAASDELKKKLEAEKTAALGAADAQLVSAQAALDAAKAKLEAANKMAAHHRATGAEDDVEGYAFTQTDTEERAFNLASAALDAEKKRVEALRLEYQHLGKSKEELNKLPPVSPSSDKPDDGLSEMEKQLKKQGEIFKKFLAGKSAATTKAAKTDAEKLIEAQDAEIAGLKSVGAQLSMNEIAYYRRTLGFKNFAPEIIKEAEALKYQNTLLAQQQALDNEETALSPKITAQYEVDLSKKGLKPEDVEALADRKIAITFEAGYLDLRDQQAQLTLTDEMYRRATLAAKGYKQEQIDALVTQQNANTVLTEQRSLLEEEIALRPKLTDLYEKELKDKGIEKRTVDILVNEKIRLSFVAMQKELVAANSQLDIGAVAFQRNTLEAKGYNAEQIKTIQGLTARKKAMEAVKGAQESLSADERALSSSLTVDLEFELTEAGVDADKIKELVNDKLALAFKELTQELERSNQQITMGALAYRKLELGALGYSAAQIKIIQNKELKNAYDAEMKSLTASSVALKQNTAEKYKAELQAKGLSGALLNQLTAQQLQNVYDAEIKSLNEASAALKQNTSEKYKAELQAKGLSGALLDQAVAQQLQNVYDAEIQSLEEANTLLKQNAREKYESELRAKGLTGELLKQATAQEYNNALLKEQNALAASAAGAGQSNAEKYKADYLDQGFSTDDATALASEKITQDFDAMKLALQDNRNEILMTADAYRLLGLEMKDGLSPKQAAFILNMEKQDAALEKQKQRTQEWRDIATDSFDAVGNNLTALAMGGEADWKGMVSSMIQQAFELAVIKPMIDTLTKSFEAMFAAQSGGGSGSVGGSGVVDGIANFVTSLFATGGAFGAGGVQYFASGGSFTNSVVSTPTAFGMDSGIGVMGEAGPEAIMPLSRMSSGNLGVEVDVSGTPPVSVSVAPNIIVQQPASSASSSAITVQLIEDASKAGSVTQETIGSEEVIQIVVANIRNNGEISQADQQVYGLSRVGVL